ncbi:type IV secretion system protein VirD4 [Azospirillum fermentarium]|uniref:type IV secretory system conjugative DNA transfer family protein n=1 Tax=Azospirillum fermentarium TaxID=1233114 RepID=UPI002227904F|nr:type IV secretory system conjugative DNA transfer family protein [Azospirillum fermentarium]MCW2249285.1 type IV secretion system protein VirD4 [Azospirillum fermentarium]
MTEPSSIILGAYGREPLRERTLQPVLVIGPTGSGKTTTVVHPTLLAAWRESAVVWDFKGSVTEDTSRARTRFGDVIVLDLARSGGPRYNPLMAVRPEPYLVPDCQHAARILTEGEQEGHWRNAAFSYLTGVFVFLLTAAADSEKSLAGARRHILLGDDGLALMLAEGVHPTAQRAAQELWDKSLAAADTAERDEAAGKPKGGRGGGADKSLHYRKSVYVTASVLLAEFEDPVLEAQTAVSDFSISDLVAGERPVTLYIVARPLDARRLRRVFKLILTQMVDFLTIDRILADDGRARRWRLLVALDEFLQFHLREAAEWIKYVREYGIRLLLLAQSLSEVEEEYGRGLTANCRLVVFRPNSSDEAERISRMVGEAIEEVPTRSTSKGLLDLFPTVSRGVRVDRRPVMPMHAALEMDGNDLIVFGYGKPIRATRLHPYADPLWRPLYGRAAAAWTPNPDANRWFGTGHPADTAARAPDPPAPPHRPGTLPRLWT